jgi:hypothetical protein
MTDMRSAVISMPGRTTTQSVSLTLGVRYPSRALFVNPGPASGSLRTVGTTNAAINLTIENATANGEVGDFWDGTARSYNTGGIEYRPNYNLFATAPRTIYEHSVLYNGFGDDTTIPITGQAMVSDDRITLVTLNGSLSESRVGDTAIDFEPVSSDVQTVEVYNASHPITISAPTQMSESEWESVFEDELTNGNVTWVNTTALPSVEGFSLLEIQLEPGNYSLQLAKVGVGTGVRGTERAYLTDVRGQTFNIQEEGSTRLTVQARDRYNVPISDVEVNASIENGPENGSLKLDSKTTDAEGEATFEYEADDINGVKERSFRVNISMEVDPGSTFQGNTSKNVTMNVNVQNTDGSGVGGGGGSDAAYDTTWTDPSDPSEQPGTSNCDADSCTLDASVSRTLNLTMGTFPTADSVTVEYAVNDTTTGTLSLKEGKTDADGGNQTQLTAQSGGAVKVYTSSGGSGDMIEILLENFPEITYASEFNDGGGTDTRENQSIPPSTTVGGISNFKNMLATNDSTATFAEENTGNPIFPNWALQVGTATREIPTGTDHQLEIRYETSGDDEPMEVRVVDENGNEIDTGTTYLLSDVNSSTIATFDLSSQEESYLNNNGNLYLEWRGTVGDDTQTIIEVYYQRVLTST